MATANQIGQISIKLLAAVFVAVFLVIGFIGLVLPIIPGLLFLAIAIWIVARAFPSIRSKLRQNSTLRKHLDKADEFVDEDFVDKVKLGLLLAAKFVLDGLAFIETLITDAFRRATAKDAPAKDRYY